MDEIYRNGDKVFYKRPNEDGWRGPGRVIGQDGVVFVQHGSQLVRVHVCRTKKVQDEMIRGNGNESFMTKKTQMQCAPNPFEISEYW